MPDVSHLRPPWRVLVYLLLGVALTWPAAVELGRAVPGADRTDLWNALWSLWFVAESVAGGHVPWHTLLLDPPGGGTLLVADLLNAALAVPLVPVFGLPAAYTLLVIGHLALSGWAAHRLAAAVAGHLGLPDQVAGWIAGVGYASAPVLLAAIHNGTSEGIGGGWAALAAWACFAVARDGGRRRSLVAALALALAAAGSWYGAVVAFLFAGALALVGLQGSWRRTLVPRVAALALGVALVLPLAWASQTAVSGADNLVRIKNPRELMTVRRSTGPADVRGYVMPGDFRSPDFRQLSRYGEQFFHCHYLGWVLIAGSLLMLRRRRDTGWLWLAGLSGLLLSLGPVAVRDGAAWIILSDRAVPLPYLLVEWSPGFSGLSLLYRLAQAPALAAAVLAGCGLSSLRPPHRRGRPSAITPRLWQHGLIAAGSLAILLEGWLLCPLGLRPGVTPAVVAPSIEVLADAPPGVVLNFPVVGGRRYLYEQTVHQHPMAGTLNFPNSAAGQRAWSGLLAAAAAAEEVTPDEPAGSAQAVFASTATHRAQLAGVRYVVVHDDPWARPDMQDSAVLALEQSLQPIASGADDVGEVRVYALW